MEILNEFSTTELIYTAAGVVGVVISFFTTILLLYRSIIKKIDDGLSKLDTKIDTRFAEVRREIQDGDAALREDIRTLTTVVIGLAERVGETRGQPQEVPAPAEGIAQTG
ncbi:MAG: hypothetical protein OXH95_03600 [bacterium]|nr:hypothetical protein [bacterium]